MGIYLDRDLRRTQFVLAVARDLHFGKAAARLNIAQSYLSREVKEFEDEQGYLFFERNGHYVAAVTDPGQMFIRTMGPALDDLLAVFERASERGRMNWIVQHWLLATCSRSDIRTGAFDP